MNSDRIKEIQKTTAYPESFSVKQALLQVWTSVNKSKLKWQKQLITKDIRMHREKLVKK